MKKIVIILGIVFVILFFIIKSFTCDTEIKEIILPENRQIKLIAKIKNCGATTGYVYQLYMLGIDDKLGILDDSIFESDDNSPNLSWHNNHLIIETNSTRVYKFTNFRWIDGKEYLIRLKSP